MRRWVLMEAKNWNKRGWNGERGFPGGRMEEKGFM